MVSNVPNIHLGIYKNDQNFHPLIFYGYTRLRGVGADLPQPRANAYARKKSMGGNSDDFFIILSIYEVR